MDIIDREYRRCLTTDDESGVAGRRSFGEWAIRVGVREFYDRVGISLPVAELWGVVGVRQYYNRRGRDTDDESPVAGCRDVREWQIPGGVFE
jgi:hypothetical protein